MGEADNLAALMAMPGQWVDRIRHRRPIKKLILDMDSSVSEIYGRQESEGSPAAVRRPLQSIVGHFSPLAHTESF